MSPALLLPLAYLSGSIPFGVIIASRFAGKNVQAEGSGNIGATNVARVAGKKLGAIVLVLDALKGTLPVVLSQQLFPSELGWHCGVGLAAFFGHVFPVWLKFKGGKGVATAAGVLVVLVPWGALAGFLVWALVMAVFRVSSVGSLLGALVAIAVAFFGPGPREYAILAVVFLGLMLVTHRANLQRLVAGKENKV